MENDEEEVDYIGEYGQEQGSVENGVEYGSVWSGPRLCGGGVDEALYVVDNQQ